MRYGATRPTIQIGFTNRETEFSDQSPTTSCSRPHAAVLLNRRNEADD